jgi:hypothetical protein
MTRRYLHSLITTGTLAFLAGCGGSGHQPGDSTPITITWTLDIHAQQAVPFGARVFLDGEQVYLESSPVQSAHRIILIRPYAAGEHVLEVEIVSSQEVRPMVYTASCTAMKANGTGVHADGIPWTLLVGERLTLRVSV